MMYLELVEFGQLKGTKLEQDGWDFFALPGFADGKGVAQSDQQIRHVMDDLMAKAIADIKASG